MTLLLLKFKEEAGTLTHFDNFNAKKFEKYTFANLIIFLA